MYTSVSCWTIKRNDWRLRASKQGLYKLETISFQAISPSTFTVAEVLLFIGAVIAIAVSVANLVYSVRLVNALKDVRSPYDDVAIEIQRWDLIANVFITVTSVCAFVIAYRLLRTAMPPANDNAWVYVLFTLGFIAVIALPIVKFIGGMRSMNILISRGGGDAAN
jgi:hypothetical protein